MKRAIPAGFLALLGGLAAGCRTPPHPPAGESGRPGMERSIGRILRVNTEWNFVILECVGLPLEDEELTVYRGSEPVGTVRVGKSLHVPFVAADRITGEPRRGDTVRRMIARQERSLEDKE